MTFAIFSFCTTCRWLVCNGMVVLIGVDGIDGIDGIDGMRADELACFAIYPCCLRALGRRTRPRS
jgi:hypothetical protein